jgi:hypothetical protein
VPGLGVESLPDETAQTSVPGSRCVRALPAAGAAVVLLTTGRLRGPRTRDGATALRAYELDDGPEALAERD